MDATLIYKVQQALDSFIKDKVLSLNNNDDVVDTSIVLSFQAPDNEFTTGLGSDPADRKSVV